MLTLLPIDIFTTSWLQSLPLHLLFLLDILFHYDLTLYICHIINSLEFMPPCTRFVTPQYKVEYQLKKIIE